MVILDDEIIKIKYNLIVETENVKTGEKKQQKIHNLITTLGKNVIRDLIGNDGISGIQYFAVGTGNTTPAIGDTLLDTEVFRGQITSFLKGSGTITAKYYLSSTQGNGNDLEEAGLFGRDATSSADTGDLIARALFTQISKTSLLKITFTWLITIV